MSDEELEVQTVVIGAGVVGLAVARQLARQGRDVLVLESGPRLGEGISSRNSEVIHAGLYYPTDSLKARFCVRGRELLYEYCESHQVRHRQCGKWIVASSEDQLERLGALSDQAALNGVVLKAADSGVVQAALPELRVAGGLWSERTGIVDSHGLMLALLGELEDAGGRLAVQCPVTAIESNAKGHRIEIGGEEPMVLLAQEVVNAAGLGAPSVAAAWQGMPDACKPRQWLARGVYFSYAGRHPFETLVYPLPENGGLGVHLTLDLAGGARFGPDVEWVAVEDYQVDPQRADAFARSIQGWWPGLDATKLQPSYAGIRPKLAGPDDGFADFRVEGPQQHGLAGAVQLFGIESPGLTSCLALAEYVAEQLNEGGR
ncbi:MAG: NAD(P)/FAD-dependent oxidoreductase [Pseudomonadota bacterium]|nr:NAD(P)/FAD-dependent oxidoreductase [Pseudomonadota bacterium]